MPKVLAGSPNICTLDAFQRAVEAGNVAELRMLNYTDEHLKQRDHRDNTMLHLACEKERYEMVEFLLREKPDLEAKNHDKDTPLIIAVKKKNLALTKTLVQAGANIKVLTKEENTLLHVAVEKGALSIIEWLIQNGVSINALGKECNTPLQLAASLYFSGVKEVVRLLLKYNADMTLCDINGNTPLHAAVNFYSHYDATDVIQLFLEKLPVEVKNNAGETPLHIGCKTDHIAVTILSNNDNDTKKVSVAKDSDGSNDPKTAVVSFLISRGAKVTTVDNEGNTPLHVVSNKRVEIAKFLIRCGAKLEAVNHKGETPLQVAAREAKRDIVKLLIDLGANINTCDSAGNTLLHHAAEGGHVWLAELLMGNKKLNVNIENTAGETPLTKSIMNEQEDLIKLLLTKGAQVASGSIGIALQKNKSVKVLTQLLEHKADANIKCPEKDEKYNIQYTPLGLAITQKNIQVVEILLKYKANVNAKFTWHSHEITPLGLALYHNDIKIIELLLQHKADVNGKFPWAGREWTPLVYAIDKKNSKIIQLLLQYKADVNGKFIYISSEQTPLAYAKEKFPEVTPLLQSYGAIEKIETITTNTNSVKASTHTQSTTTSINRNSNEVNVYASPKPAKTNVLTDEQQKQLQIEIDNLKQQNLALERKLQSTIRLQQQQNNTKTHFNRSAFAFAILGAAFYFTYAEKDYRVKLAGTLLIALSLYQMLNKTGQAVTHTRQYVGSFFTKKQNTIKDQHNEVAAQRKVLRPGKKMM